MGSKFQKAGDMIRSRENNSEVRMIDSDGMRGKARRSESSQEGNKWTEDHMYSTESFPNVS